MDRSRTLLLEVFAVATLNSMWEGLTMAKKENGKRELIDTGRDKRFVRRDDQGRFEEVVDVGRSLSEDVRHHAKTKVPPGQGDRGDQKRRGH
jgi:hypothetical protein